MIPILALNPEIIMTLGPAAAFLLICIAIYAVYVNTWGKK